eukprot:6192836-Prymnesium_polylepis.1
MRPSTSVLVAQLIVIAPHCTPPTSRDRAYKFSSAGAGLVPQPIRCLVTPPMMAVGGWRRASASRRRRSARTSGAETD